MKSVNTITKAIHAADLSMVELNALIANIQSIKEFNAQLSLSVGDAVMVVQKTKKTPGTIVKINKTRCIVEMKGGKYNVPMTMLEAA